MLKTMLNSLFTEMQELNKRWANSFRVDPGQYTKQNVSCSEVAKYN